LIEYSKIQDYLDQLIALSKDQSVPKYATHLVYLSAVREEDSVESKIMYSILQKQPKRADIYWFAHIEVTDEPYTMEYKVRILAPDDAVRIDFRLGFRVQQRITLFLRQIIGEMIKKKEIDITSRYHSLREQNITGDFRFVLVEEVLSSDNELPASEQFVMSTYFWVKNFTASPEKWFGLDTSNVTIEKTPFVIRPATGINLVRTN
jgi:KUP system potassium uptake protein